MSEQGERSAFRLVVVGVLSAVFGGILALQLRPQAGRYELLDGTTTRRLFDTATGALYWQEYDGGTEQWGLGVDPLGNG